MTLRTKIGLALGGALAVGLLLAPVTAHADPTPHYTVTGNSSLLTATVTGYEATITATATGGAMCSTPIVTRGTVDAAALQEALDQFAINPGSTPSLPGISDLSNVVYPTVVTTTPPTFDPPLASFTTATSPYTVALPSLTDDTYSALTGCVDPAEPYEFVYHLRSFQIGATVPNPDDDNDNDSGGEGSAGSAGSLGNIFGS
ncbi:hypothetical protein D6M20_01775 (plasmid) [Rhodococcus qingshengii]|jgi:hypothetical protein|uniref:hypothetical protein n=2 Tax=Bacillati TaxID=1783272 RepID=UPI0011EC05D3|nr:hypothetical protein [Rhodococcus qingshengii]QEM25575.1 hypothetical protein D6M20_01775 [Rhodococcus qingshengii]